MFFSASLVERVVCRDFLFGSLCEILSTSNLPTFLEVPLLFLFFLFLVSLICIFAQNRDKYLKLFNVMDLRV